MRYFKKLAGERIYLSPMNIDDVEIYTKWLNDYNVSGNLGNFTKMISLSNEKKALENMTSDGQNYAIVLNEGDFLIGNLGLMDINHLSRRATVGIFIGESEYRGRGYGAEALKLILNYGFNTLNFHNIMLEAHSDNDQAIACYKKVGFCEFGRRHEAKFKDGKYIDIVYMEILDSDFNKGK